MSPRATLTFQPPSRRCFRDRATFLPRASTRLSPLPCQLGVAPMQLGRPGLAQNRCLLRCVQGMKGSVRTAALVWPGRGGPARGVPHMCVCVGHRSGSPLPSPGLLLPQLLASPRRLLPPGVGPRPLLCLSCPPGDPHSQVPSFTKPRSVNSEAGLSVPSKAPSLPL